APATLMALRDGGAQVVNVACSLGRTSERDVRRRELERACRLARFELVVPQTPVPISSTEADPDAARELALLVRTQVEAHEPQIVVSPSPHDRHPGHELVGRTVREVLSAGTAVESWWTWTVWASLPQPTLATAFDNDRLGEILQALSAHRSQLQRNDYRRLLTGRAQMNAALAPELLFGFGAGAGPDEVEYAELLSEISLAGGWRAGQPRWLDPVRPLAPHI
ncbi:MAG TPA: PIG-L family deacetylase, partial [Solirubrobacteraceae bacterium]|nr:PIG-L family deacetylase [Solirubrobacteraceae bacterium]